ncbi:hypothetical protein DICPUDRAFT_46059 [Dictyostelium purpureum]|uniref:Vesicle-fusing ATPase n=1 Tax=Dictyostelium purpureum TaxID=5786 RepID=F0ZDC9_DICPU|nr:uncharacterized protein DICPUDRAFT_46059 [Dictyostelium purpureum]EGC38020.1 hypothetical protein DICPUDRAFT_46059 [Dictyostelium purpureum]|eukprot:XP_003285421.1 hypothetical protein DICPUDRAFT_46059 [Dictyostelium purpureum]
MSYPPPIGDSIKLKVQVSNNEEEAYTNRAVLNMASFRFLFPNVTDKQYSTNTNYIKLRAGAFEYILSASPNSSMKSDSIALSKALRGWMNLSNNEEVYVEFYDPNPNLCGQMTCKVDYLSKGKTGPKQDAGAIIGKIIDNFNSQFFTAGQVFYIKNNSFIFELRVDEVIVSPGVKSSDKDKGWAIISPATNIILLKSPGSLLDIETNGPLVVNKIFTSDWDFENMGIGGLDEEFRDIFRRAFSSRIFPPAIVKKLGVNHVKGMLLHGPPGTGKTLIARQIGKMLNGREPKVVSGPSILNKYVGQSEENIRNLFRDAEMEQKAKGDDSGLHIIIFDELDAICKQRGSRSGDSGVGDSVVNQLLTMIDGVESLNNILVIGMTNRKDMIDEALLRPGRLEVHVEISLPDEHGREQIFKIHTAKMREQNALDSDVNLAAYAHDTRNYSGAEIEGVVKSAASYAFSRQVDTKNIKKVEIKPDEIKICDQDFRRAIHEVPPSFGATDTQFENYAENGIFNYGPVFDKLLQSGNAFVEQVKKSNRTPMMSVLLHGKPGCGKSSLASTLAKGSLFPYIRIISPNDLIGYNEASKASKITKIFEDSYKSPQSCIVVDEIERLIEYVPIGPRFSNLLLQTLAVLFKKSPPKGRKLLVIATTSNPDILRDMDITDSFATALNVPSISNSSDFKNVLLSLEFTQKEAEEASSYFSAPITIKQLIMIVEMARQEEGRLVDNFRSCLEDFNLRSF